MVIVRLSLLLMCHVLIINSIKISGNEEYAPHILAVLKYLNSNPNKVYNYNTGLFVNAQRKADIVELTIDVDVTCSPSYLEVPCTEQLLTCSGFLRQGVNEQDFKVLSNVVCKPKRDFSVESFVELSTISTPFQQETEIELSHEAVSTEGNADFIAVKADSVPCLGCSFDLNVNAEGVSTLVDTALRHIETEKNIKHTVVKIIRLQQQVVAGVKYILVMEIAPTVCQKSSPSSNCPVDTEASSSICEVIFLQKPWISKSKSVIRNNCTVSQSYNEEKSNSMDNKINTNKHTFNTNSNIQAITENESLDPIYLANLESQILNVEPENNKATSNINTEYEIEPISSNINLPSSSHKIPEPITARNNDKPVFTFFSNQNEYNGIKTINKKVSNDVQVDQTNTFLKDQSESDILHLTTNENKLEGNNFASEVTDDPKNESENLFSEEASPENKTASLGDVSHKYYGELENANSNSSESTANDLQNSSISTLENNSSETNDVLRNTLVSSNENSQENKDNNSPIEGTIRLKRSNNGDDNSSSSSSSSSSSEDKTIEKNETKDVTNKDDKHIKRKQKSDRNSSSSSSSSSESVNDAITVKRSIGQLEKITQEEKLLVKDLADFATSTLDSIDDDNHKRVILQILGAKKLKLDGIYYQIILRLGISECLEYEENENCEKKLLTNLTKICKVGVHVEDDFSNPKVIKSQCQNIKKDQNDKNRTNYSRYRRDILVGGASEIPLDDPRILEFTTDTLTELDSKSEFPNRHKIVNIILATSQVVSGSKYHIKANISLSDCLKNDSQSLENCDFLQNAMVKLCDIVVWDQPWLKKRHTTVTCDDSDKEYSFDYIIRNKRSVPTEADLVDEESKNKDDNMIFGGIEESSDQQKALEYLKSILNHFDMESGHNNKLKIQRILSIKKQVVAGQLWRIKAELTLSECLKSELIDPQKCKQLKGSDNLTCVFKIWDRPWLPNGREVETTCGNDSKSRKFRLKRNVGVSTDINPGSLYLDTNNESRSKILEYLKIGLDYLDLKSTYKTKYIVRKVTEISKRAAAGQLWQISAEIALSDCSKHYYTQYCEELHDSESKKCNFEVWEQPWLSSGLQINITCENDTNVYLYKKQDTNNLESKVILSKFKNFMFEHNKTYSNETEYNYRFKIFKNNLNTIKLLNKYEQGTGKYGITKFADLTTEEFSKSHGLRTDLRNENDIPFMTAPIPDITLPTEFDWRNKSAVTEVKNQGSCGSCWAFSTTGNVEGQYAIKHGKLVEFSEQELVDCDKLDEGCNGGLMDNAYRTIEKLGGLESESDYPYDARDEKCHFDKTKVRVQVTGALNISHDENDMAKWLVENGPISIAINANAMQFYLGGVSHPWKILCNPQSLDHGVLIVGFGVHKYPLFNKTLPYWTIKNSWGHSWGEQGYYRVYRGDGTCGLNQTPSSAIVA